MVSGVNMSDLNETKLSEGRMTISDVAEALGVSKTTVSRAISGKGRIGNETRDRVLKFINEHNFTPSAVAKGLAESKTYNIGWVIPGDYDLVDLPFFQNCLLGISEMASPMQYDILVSLITGKDISQLERAVTNHKIDGAILSRTLENDAPAEYLLSAGVPYVAIGLSDMKNTIQVDNDHKNACRELTSLLILKGITNMGLIGGNRNHMVTKYRYKGFLAAFKEAGISPSPDQLILDVDNQIKADKAVETLIKKKVDCIVCMDDSLCQYTLNKLKKEGINVPTDIKVASFYNSPQLEANTPSITALNFDAISLGREACRVLLNYIDGKEVEQRTLLGYDIVIKESTK